MKKADNNFGFQDWINVRDISDFLYCARKVWLRKIKKLREKPNQRIIKGKIKHDILDELNKTESNLVCGITQKLSLEELGELYKNHLFKITEIIFRENKKSVETFKINKEEFWQEFWKYFVRDVQLRVKSIHKLLEKNIFGYQLWQKLEPKYLTEFKISSPELGLNGRIDRVIIKTEDNKVQYMPCEIKNNIMKTEKPYHSELIQLACYAMLLEYKFHALVKKGFIEYKNKKIPVEINKDIRDNVQNIINDIRGFSLSKMPEINSNFNKCRYCGLREECFKIQ